MFPLDFEGPLVLKIRDNEREKFKKQKENLIQYLRQQNTEVIGQDFFAHPLVDRLTFGKIYRQKRIGRQVVSLLEGSGKAALFGDTGTFNLKLESARSLIDTLGDPQPLLRSLQERFGLFVWSPDEELWQISEFIRVERFKRSTDTEERLRLAHEVLNTAFEELEKKRDVQALSRLNEYRKELSLLLENFEGSADLIAMLETEGKVLHGLLKDNPALIQEDTVDVWLALSDTVHERTAPADRAKVRDAHIAMLIDFLELIKQRGGEIPQARTIGITLSVQLAELKEQGGYDAKSIAVSEERLTALKSFLEFLRTPAAENLHGSFDQALADFEQKKSEDALIKELIANEPAENNQAAEPSLTPEEIREKAQADFASIGLTQGTLEVPESSTDSVLVQSAQYAGVTFNAVYNVEKKIFSKITVGETVIDPSVTLENLQSFLFALQGKNDTPAVSESPPEVSPTDVGKSQERLERIATAHAINTIQKLDLFVIEKDDLKIANLDLNEFAIQNAQWQDAAAEVYVVSFIWNSETNSIRSLVLKTPLGDIPVNEIRDIFDIKEKAELIVKRAALEKERLDEFENGLESGGE